VLPFAEIDRGHGPERVVVPYLNYYLGNGFVLIPTCGHRADADMVDLIAEQYPGREAVVLDVGAVLAAGGGGIHCITQQIPA
jgi:agmatine deiminase